MSYPAHVRLADASEEEDIMQVCRELHTENGLFPLDEALVRDMLRRAFNRDKGILGVIGMPGKLEAISYMLVSNFWYSSHPHLEELFVYVRPQFRETQDLPQDQKFSRVRALAEFAKWCSDETGFPLIIGVISDERTEGKVRLYRRYFGDPIGNFFYYSADKKFATGA